MRTIQKILIHVKTGRKYLVKDLQDDYHTQYGVVKAKDFKKTRLESGKNEKFLCLEPNFADLWENLSRGPQIITHKDIGLILAKTGVNSRSKIVDAGGGSGSLCLALANVGKEVTTYEINPEHYDIISRNKQLFGMKNLNIKQTNVYDGIEEKELDLITLDLPEPWKMVEPAEKSLKEGGFLVVYLPNLTQMKTFIDSCRGTAIKIIETVELLERKWKIEDKIMRPEFEMLGHTGFLTFCRRL
ncbi:MAG TPA: methyltransferase [Candidatus Nanoarchaeia archaeon]|nr:methyltransferase [Candidatus Nanoarchaeia archaeon]